MVLRRRFKRHPIRMVEVGVFRGETSAVLLARFPSLDLTLIDPWDAGPDYDDNRITAAMMKEAKVEAIRAVASYSDRCRVLACCSIDAAWLFDDATQHIVFIDGDHSEAAVRSDISLWRQKVMPGGVLCGHDYRPWNVGLRMAVDELVPEREVWSGGVWVTGVTPTVDRPTPPS